MSFLTLNGIDFGVAAPSGATQKPEIIGAGVTRAADGSPRKNYQAKKQHPKFKTPPMAQDKAFFLEQLVVGEGERASFDVGLNGDKGTVPTTAGTAPARITALPAPKYGAGALKVLSGTGNTITWAVGAAPAGWTVLVWVNINQAGWHLYIVSGNAGSTVISVWLDGVAQAPGSPAWLVVDAVNGTLQLKGVAGGSPANDYAYDDLVFIPAALPTAWAASLNTFLSGVSGVAWGKFTQLTAAGDFHPCSLTVTGDPASIDVEQIQGALPGAAFADNLRAVSFDLVEV